MGLVTLLSLARLTVGDLRRRTRSSQFLALIVNAVSI